MNHVLGEEGLMLSEPILVLLLLTDDNGSAVIL